MKHLKYIISLIYFLNLQSVFSQENLLQPLVSTVKIKGNDTIYSDVNWFKTQSDTLIQIPYQNKFGFANDSMNLSAVFFGDWSFLENPKVEYVQSKLLKSLVKGKKYHLEFYIRLSGNSAWAVKDVGILFSKSRIRFSEYYIDAEPTIRSRLPISKKPKWYKIEGDFVATGGEQYILIGHFPKKDDLLPVAFFFQNDLKRNLEGWEELINLPNQSSPDEMYDKYLTFHDLLNDAYQKSLEYDKNSLSHYDMTATYEFKNFSLIEMKVEMANSESKTIPEIDTRNLVNLVANSGFESLPESKRNKYEQLDSLFLASPEIYYMNFFRRNFEKSRITPYLGSVVKDTQLLKSGNPEIYYSINYFRQMVAPKITPEKRSYYKSGFFNYHTIKPEYKFSGERSWYSYHLQPGAGDLFTVNWTHPTLGLPEWIHIDSTDNRIISVENKIKTKDLLKRDLSPRTGEGMAAANLHFDGHKNFLDPEEVPGYLQTKLKKPLIAGTTYYLEFYIKPDANTRWTTRNIGALFTKYPYILASNETYAPNELLLKKSLVSKHEILLLDISSSMEHNLEFLKGRVKNYILNHSEETLFTLVVFAEKQKILLRDVSKNDLIEKFYLIDSLETDGETLGDEALIFAFGLFKDKTSVKGRRKVVLFSDAHFVVSHSGLKYIQKGISNHVALSLELFGMKHNRTLEHLDFDDLDFVKLNSTVTINEIVSEIDKDEYLSKPLVAIEVKPQIIEDNPENLNNTKSWTKISGCFTANGGEEYLTVGSFYYCGSCAEEKYFDSEISKELNHSAYYYFDDFYLKEDSVCIERVRKVNSKSDNLIVMIDVSASMFNSKIMENLIDDLVNYVEDIGKTKRMTIITFSSHTQVLVKNQKITDTDSLRTVLNQIKEGGGTKVNDVVAEGYRIINTLFDASVTNQMIIFSDGKFKFDKATVNNIAFNYEEKKITLSMFQFGEFYNKDIEKILEQNGGFYTTELTETPSKLLTKLTENKSKQCYCPGKD